MQNITTSSPLTKLVLQNNPNAPKQNQALSFLTNAGTNSTALQTTAPAPGLTKQNNVKIINPLLMLSTFGILLFSLVSASNASKATKSINELGGQLESLVQKLQGNIQNNPSIGEIDKLQKAVSALCTEIQNSKITNAQELGKLTNLINELKQIAQKTTSTKTASNTDAIMSQITSAINANTKFAQEEMSSHAIFLSDKLLSLLAQLQESISKVSQTAENNPSAKTSLYQEAARVLEEASNLMTQNALRTQEKIGQTSKETFGIFTTTLDEQLSKLEGKIKSLDSAAEKIATSQNTFVEQSKIATQKMGDIETRIQSSINKLGEFSPQKAIQQIEDYSKQAMAQISQNTSSINKEMYEQLLKQINTTADAAINLITKTAADASQDSQALIQNELTNSLTQIQKIVQDAQKVSLQAQETLQQTQKFTPLEQGEKISQISASIGDILKPASEIPPVKQTSGINKLDTIYFSKDPITQQSYAISKETNERFNGEITDRLKSGMPISIKFKDGLLEESVVGDKKSADFIRKVYTRIPTDDPSKQKYKIETFDPSSPVVKILNGITQYQTTEKQPLRMFSIILKDTSSKIKKEVIKLVKKGDNLTLFDANSAPNKTRVVKKQGENITQTIKEGIKTSGKKAENGYLFLGLDMKI